jgi:ubiquinone/menaquinone biosynthesis C-methylase UbiE
MSKYMDYKEKYIPEYKFGSFTKYDGTVAFYTRLHAMIDSKMSIADIGCGRGRFMDEESVILQNIRNFRGKVKKVVGIDVDNSAVSNPYIDEFRLIDSELLPTEHNEFDLIFCDWTIEHIEKPEKFFQEVYRSLKKGGVFAFRTSNIFHYVSIAASIIPNSKHASITAKVQSGRAEEDVFPTFFKANSPSKIKKLFKNSGFSIFTIYTIEGAPNYLAFSSFLFRVGLLIRRIMPSFLRHTILAFARK